MEQTNVFKSKKTLRFNWIKSLKRRLFKYKLKTYLHGLIEHFITAYMDDADEYFNNIIYISIYGFDYSISKTLEIDNYSDTVNEIVDSIPADELYLVITLKESTMQPLWSITRTFKNDFNINEQVTK